MEGYWAKAKRWASAYWAGPQVFGLQAGSIGPWVWSGLVQLNRSFWAGLRFGPLKLGWAEGRGQGRNGLALPGSGFGLTRIRGSRLPYPTLADFPASFLSPSRGVFVADFGPLPSLFLFVRRPSFLFWEFCGLKAPKSHRSKNRLRNLTFRPRLPTTTLTK